MQYMQYTHRMYFTVFPRIYTCFIFQKRSPFRDVQITSLRLMFIHTSQFTRCWLDGGVSE